MSARLGQAAILLVCLAVVIGALWGFTWLVIELVELMDAQVQP